MKIILGSSSEGRKLMMHELGFDFEVMSPDVDEKEIRHENGEQLTMAIALAKTRALLSKISLPAILITADSVGVCNGEIFEKPKDKEEAIYYFSQYNKSFPLQIVTTLVVTNTATSKQAKATDKSGIVYLKPIPDDFIEQYIAKGRSFVGAGGFVVHDQEIKEYIDHIEGTTDAITGFPKEVLLRLIEEVK